MTRLGLGMAIGWLAAFAAIAHAQSPSEAVLQGKALERKGGTFVLTSEAKALEKVTELKGAYAHLAAARAKLADADLNTQMITALTQQAAYLKQEQNAINNQARGGYMPRGARMMVNQTINAERQIEQMSINQVNAALTARKQAALSPQARKDLEADAAKRRDEMSQAATEARGLVDEVNATYATLAKDESVKSALVAVKAHTTDAIKLGPSKDFLAGVKALDTAERMLHLKTSAAEETPKHHTPRAKLKR